jgi:eukaryotic-like serine/threonine-protein kinase
MESTVSDGEATESDRKLLGSDGGGDSAGAPSAAAEATPLRRGANVGRYIIIERLGRGAMGVVYKAFDPELDRKIAIKLLRPEVRAGISAAVSRARLLREAQAMARLSHPNVIAVFDVGTFEDEVFVAMELVSGSSLADVLRGKRQAPWREVVGLFLQAGRGLSAAHKAGLVHRDFKPGNVLVGDDGRVRVLDFGLARSADDADVAATDAPDLADTALSAPGALSTPLTRTGSFLGTPAYMAPEQWQRQPAGARADQFSFCVALYEALYGERPFAGETLDELAAEILSGELRRVPSNSAVPPRFRAILRRGLSRAPEGRFPSMDALLLALQEDPAARRQRSMLGAVIGVALAVGALGLWRGWRGMNVNPCAGAAEGLAAAWNDARRESIASAFSATHLSYAAGAATNAVRALDHFAASWSAMRNDACEATRVRSVQSGELMDLRMQCLDRRLEDFTAAIDVLAAADARSVERASEIAGWLPRLDECADAAALRAPVRPPKDPATRARVAALDKTLARANADLGADKSAEGLSLIAPAVVEAHAVGHRPTEALALFTQGLLYDVDGKYDQAEQSLREAALAAEAGRDDRLAARALTSLVWVVGERRGRYGEARALARQAQAKIERQDHAELLSAELESQLANVDLDDSKLDAALLHAKAALAIRQKALDESDPDVAHSWSDLGNVSVQMARWDDARSELEKALAIYEKTLGPDHPKVGSVLTNLGTILRTQGKYDDALARYQRARKIIESALGAGHPDLASIYINEASVLRAQGKLDEATSEYQHALELWTAALGADHPNVGTVYYYLGDMALDEGKPSLAIEQFNRALKIWETKLGPGNPALAEPLKGIGEALRKQHQLAKAEAPLLRSVKVAEEGLGHDHPGVAPTLRSLGELYLDERKPDKAAPLFEHELAIRAAHPGDKVDEAVARFDLARAVEPRDRVRARELAVEARALFAAGNSKTQVAAVDKFLEH